MVPAWDLLIKSVLYMEREKEITVKVVVQAFIHNYLLNPQKEEFMVGAARMITQRRQSNPYSVVPLVFVAKLSDELLLLDCYLVLTGKAKRTQLSAEALGGILY